MTLIFYKPRDESQLALSKLNGISFSQRNTLLTLSMLWHYADDGHDKRIQKNEPPIIREFKQRFSCIPE